METAILTFIIGIIVSVLGYLLKRWWEGQATKESIQEAVQLANLHKEIRSGSFTLDALAALKGDIKTRAATSQKYQEEVFAGIERAVEEKNKTRTVEYEPQSQREMNQYAFHLAELANHELEFVVRALEGHLSESEQVAFENAQKAWKEFAEKQSEFESLEAEGGSMQPLLWASARRLLTIERAAQVKEEVNKRNRIEY